MSYEDLQEAHNIIVGSPETVAARIAELQDRHGVEYLNLLPAFFGYLPPPLLRWSLELFAADVMPRFCHTSSCADASSPPTADPTER